MAVAVNLDTLSMRLGSVLFKVNQVPPHHFTYTSKPPGLPSP